MTVRQSVHEWQQKRARFATACFSNGHQVTAGQNNGPSLCLNRCRCGVRVRQYLSYDGTKRCRVERLVGSHVGIETGDRDVMFGAVGNGGGCGGGRTLTFESGLERSIFCGVLTAFPFFLRGSGSSQSFGCHVGRFGGLNLFSSGVGVLFQGLVRSFKGQWTLCRL